jgi:hypothetical protein
MIYTLPVFDSEPLANSSVKLPVSAIYRLEMGGLHRVYNGAALLLLLVHLESSPVLFLPTAMKVASSTLRSSLSNLGRLQKQEQCTLYVKL